MTEEGAVRGERGGGAVAAQEQEPQSAAGATLTQAQKNRSSGSRLGPCRVNISAEEKEETGKKKKRKK